MRVINPRCGCAGNPSGRITDDWNLRSGSMDVKEWEWCTSMRNGDGLLVADIDVELESKKFGQTRPPIRSSSFAMVEFGIMESGRSERRKRRAPFHAGHTGMRAYFWIDAILL